MKYKSVVMTKRGTPDVLQIIEKELNAPQTSEVLIKVLASGVGRTDVAMRYGYYPFAPKIPFTPGYEIIGRVEAVGDVVSQFKEGDYVAALTVYGGYAEYITLQAEELVLLPPTLDPATAVALILNYVTAYQMLHRTARVKEGDKVLITGASGGVGSALLQLGKLAGLQMYGTASAQNHHLLTKHGAVPIDYKTQDFVAAIKQAEPEGLNFVFDGIAGKNIRAGFQLLKPGGQLIEYGYPSFSGMLRALLQLKIGSWLPNGRSGQFYGITAQYRKDKRPFQEDLATLFELLAKGHIQPIIARQLPILEAARANWLLETENIPGKIVLAG